MSISTDSNVFKLSHKSLTQIAAMIWFIAGFMLFRKGLFFLKELTDESTLSLQEYPLLSSIMGYTVDLEMAIVVLIAIGLGLGMVKSVFVLRKVARKNIARLQDSPNPAPLSHLFGVRFFAMVTAAALMGYFVNQVGLPIDIRAVIDIAVGAALLNASMAFRLDL